MPSARDRGVYVEEHTLVGHVELTFVFSDGVVKARTLLATELWTRETLASAEAWLDQMDPVARLTLAAS